MAVSLGNALQSWWMFNIYVYCRVSFTGPLSIWGSDCSVNVDSNFATFLAMVYYHLTHHWAIPRNFDSQRPTFGDRKLSIQESEEQMDHFFRFIQMTINGWISSPSDQLSILIAY